jgi:hypothetical protein
MHRRAPVAISALAIAASSLIALPPATAGDMVGAIPDLSGRWNSASLRQDHVGYSMRLTTQCSPATCYDAVLQMTFQDGTKGPKLKAGVTIDGGRAYLLLQEKGSLAGGSPDTMVGMIGMDGSLYFPTCYKQLSYVAKSDRAMMCSFQEFAR